MGSSALSLSRVDAIVDDAASITELIDALIDRGISDPSRAAEAIRALKDDAWLADEFLLNAHNLLAILARARISERRKAAEREVVARVEPDRKKRYLSAYTWIPVIGTVRNELLTEEHLRTRADWMESLAAAHVATATSCHALADRIRDEGVETLGQVTGDLSRELLGALGD